MVIGAGVELLIMTGKKAVGQFTLPYLSVGIHARIRWTETVKIVGTQAKKHDRLGKILVLTPCGG
jgi:hypothetical protein